MIQMGARIRQLRSGRNMTQAMLAQRLGVTKSVVSAYENGMRYPSYDVLLNLADIYGVSTDYLLGHSRQNVVDVTGLTPNQIEGVIALVEALRRPE